MTTIVGYVAVGWHITPHGTPRDHFIAGNPWPSRDMAACHVETLLHKRDVWDLARRRRKPRIGYAVVTLTIESEGR